MANKTVTVLEADGVTETDIVSLDVGRQAAAASKSLALSTEDKTVLDSLDTKLSTIDGRVDGLETLIGSTNSKLDTLAGYLDGLETLITSTNTKIDTLDGSVDAITTAVGALADEAVETSAPGAAPASGNTIEVQGNASGTPVPTTLSGTNNIATVTAVTAITNALPAGTNAIGKVDHTTTGIGHGVTTVTTAGTDVVLASSTAAKWVTIQAQTDNTGVIAVGATGVDATVASGNGVALAAGESITLPVDNLADVFIDATVSTDGVRYTYGT